MQPIILNHIPFEVDTDRLMDSLHVAAESAAASGFGEQKVWLKRQLGESP